VRHRGVQSPSTTAIHPAREIGLNSFDEAVLANNRLDRWCGDLGDCRKQYAAGYTFTLLTAIDEPDLYRYNHHQRPSEIQ